MTLSEPHVPLVIAIDGPAASGKGTLARRLAEYFGYQYLDTGSLYRAVGLRLIHSGKDPRNTQEAISAAIAINEQDLNHPELRQESTGQAASIVSAYPEVRSILLDFQQRFAKHPCGAVLDGRDIGTVVCPQAHVKIFVTASVEARAKRRHRELQNEGGNLSYDAVLNDLQERDMRDTMRAIAPLIPAADAVILDTSGMDAASVFATASQLIHARFPGTLANVRATR